jgi:two-component system, LytTR family, response regulator
MLNTNIIFISVATNRGLLDIPVQHIIRIQGLSNYSRIFFNNGQYPLTVARVLKRFEEDLPEGNFIRTHRTHLVNRDFVAHIRLNALHPYIELRNGEMISVSRRKKRMLEGNNK